MRFSQRWGVRWGMLSAMGGIIGYCIPALGLLGGEAFSSNTGTFTILGITLIGLAAGWLIGVLWYLLPRIQKHS